jgi:predicted dithiol-disulfide oxidoreductase (DUF899 family)
MGWSFKWVSSFGSDFNFDFDVSFTPETLASGQGYFNYQQSEIKSEELPGTSVFYKDERGDVFHTYSCYGRGDERLVGTYAFLDLLPKGREENGPSFDLSDWARRRDEYPPEPVQRQRPPGCCSSD